MKSAGLFLIAAASVAGLDVPKPAPPLAFRVAGGGQVELSQFKGKVVAIEFLLTTCPHCQECSRKLQQMQQEFGPRGFQALGIAVNEMAHMLVSDYVSNFGLSFPVGFAPKEVAHEFLQHPLMMIMYFPQLVFIDRSGVIRAYYPGGDKFYQDEAKNMRTQIEELLKEPIKTAPAKK
jgi:peroxiredoxin